MLNQVVEDYQVVEVHLLVGRPGNLCSCRILRVASLAALVTSVAAVASFTSSSSSSLSFNCPFGKEVSADVAPSAASVTGARRLSRFRRH